MNSHDVLMYGHLWVHKHVKGLTDAQWQAPDVCGVWSTREIITHLASFEWLLVEVLAGFVDPGPTPTLDEHNKLSGDGFNAVQVGKRQNLTPAQSLAEYDQAYQKGIDLLPRLDLETLRRPGTLPWYGKEYSLEDFIVYQYYGHKREHMAQVAVYRDHLKT